MQRREFLTWMSIGAAGAALPRLMFARGADEKEAVNVDFGVIVAGALQRAKDVGKPLLVLSIDDDWKIRDTRETELGRWLNFADDAMLADLALVEVVCAPVAALRAASVADTKDDAWMHLVHTNVKELVAEAVTVIPATRSPGPPYRGTPEDDLALHEAIETHFRAQLRAVHDPFRLALKPATRLVALAEQSGAALSEEVRARVEKQVEDPASIGAEDLDRAAAFVLLRAKTRERIAATRAALAIVAKRRLREKSPNGSRWAKVGPCWIEIEGEPIDRRSPCGMSTVDVHDERFLHFLTRAKS